MNNNLNNLINKTKNITPYTNNIITANKYVKTEKIIADSGINIYGNSSNITLYADNTVKKVGPILQFYGKGGNGATVGINLDTFESNQQSTNGRINGNNPATQILAVDNGMHSSDLGFYTAPMSSNSNNLPVAIERMKIKSNGLTEIHHQNTRGDSAGAEYSGVQRTPVDRNGTFTSRNICGRSGSHSVHF